MDDGRRRLGSYKVKSSQSSFNLYRLWSIVHRPSIEECALRGRARETVSAGVRAAALDVDAVIEIDVGAMVMRDDRARRLFFKDFLSRFRRLADPLDLCVCSHGLGGFST